MTDEFKVYWKGDYPKPKKVFFDGTFGNRQKARQWCRNHEVEHEGLTIVHPDGTEEAWRRGMNREARIVDRVVAGTIVAWGLGDRPPLDRGFYVPKDVEVETVTPEGTDLDIRVYTKNGTLFGVAFAGTANRPLWHYRFRDRAQLDRRIEQTVQDRKGRLEMKQKRQEERSQFKHTLKLGDILYSSWGYDQTNVDFFQVTAVGEKSVKIRPIEQKIVGGGTGSDSVVAVPDKFTGPEKVKIVGPRNVLRMTSYSIASPWDGQPKHQTAFGYGH